MGGFLRLPDTIGKKGIGAVQMPRREPISLRRWIRTSGLVLTDAESVVQASDGLHIRRSTRAILPV